MTTSPQPQPQPDAERLISDVETLKVYFDPLRLRVIQAVAHTPRSVHEIAEALGLPFTRLYYHVNLLERHGLIRMVETRTLSGAVEEKYYQVTARTFVVDRALLTVSTAEPGNTALEVLMENVLDGTRRDIRRSAEYSLVNLQARPPAPDALLLRHSMARLPAEQARAFHTRLLALIDEFNLADSGSTSDPHYALAVALYPSALGVEDAGSESDEARK